MRKTRILSLILAVVMVATMAPLALPVFADVTVATPGENSYLDVNFKKGSANTDVVNKALHLYDRGSFWAGVKVTTTYQIDTSKTYEVQVDVRCLEPDVGGVRPITTTGYVVNSNNSLGTGSGVKYTSGVAVAGAEEGWYTFKWPYVPATNHAFELGFAGAFINGGNTSADVFFDNFVLYEDGVPVVTYNFNDDSQISDWSWNQFSGGNEATGKIKLSERTERPVVVDTTFDYYYAVTEREGFWAGAIIDPNFNVTAGEVYTITFDVWGANPAAGLRAYPTSDQKLTYNGFGNTNYIGVRFDDGTPLSGDRDGWYTHTITYEALADHNFVLRLPGCPAGGKDVATDNCDFYIDNVVITKQGETDPVFNATFTPGNDDNDAVVWWENNDGNRPAAGYTCTAVGAIVTPPPAPATSCGAGVAISTGTTAEAGKTYNLEFALKTNLEGATYFANVYTGANLEGGLLETAIAAGTADPDAEGWYVHTVQFTAANDGVVNFEILGGEDFAFINNLVKNPSIYVDSIALYENGVDDALFTANYSTISDTAEAVAYNDTNDKIAVSVTFDPGKFIKEEATGASASGILAMLLLRRRAMQNQSEEPVVPEEPVVDTNGYISITDRETFWTGAVLESFETVYADKKYTITFEAKTEDPTDDFRMSPVASGVTTDGNLGTSSGKLFTSGTPVEGKDGWYAFSIQYIPTEEHTFAVRIFGGYQAKGVTLPNVSKADFHLDNFRLYEDGVEEPILEYDFDTEKYIEDWNAFIIYTPDTPAPTFTHYMPEIPEAPAESDAPAAE